MNARARPHIVVTRCRPTTWRLALRCSHAAGASCRDPPFHHDAPPPAHTNSTTTNNHAVFHILNLLPKLGVGQRVTRTKWAPFGNSYWEITAAYPASQVCQPRKRRREQPRV